MKNGKKFYLNWPTALFYKITLLKAIMWLVIIDVFIVDFPLTLLTSRDSPLFLFVAHLSIVFSLVSFWILKPQVFCRVISIQPFITVTLEIDWKNMIELG